MNDGKILIKLRQIIIKLITQFVIIKNLQKNNIKKYDN